MAIGGGVFNPGDGLPRFIRGSVAYTDSRANVHSVNAGYEVAAADLEQKNGLGGAIGGVFGVMRHYAQEVRRAPLRPVADFAGFTRGPQAFHGRGNRTRISVEHHRE